MVSILLDLLAHILGSRFFLCFFFFVAIVRWVAEKRRKRKEEMGWGFSLNIQLFFNATGPMQLGKIGWVHASGGGERSGRAWQRHD